MKIYWHAFEGRLYLKWWGGREYIPHASEVYLCMHFIYFLTLRLILNVNLVTQRQWLFCGLGLLRGVSAGLECWWLSKVDFVLAVFCVHLSEELTVTLRLNRVLIFIPCWVGKASSVLGPYYYFLVLCILLSCPNCVKQRVCVLFQKSCSNSHFGFGSLTISFYIWQVLILDLYRASFDAKCQVSGGKDSCVF